MGYVLDGDDVAERQDIMTLQAETAALQNRVAAILTTSWDTAAQMKGYVDEMDGLLRRYNDSYGMKAFLWAAKPRPASGMTRRCRHLWMPAKGYADLLLTNAWYAAVLYPDGEWPSVLFADASLIFDA
jgi:hypothetical protein